MASMGNIRITIDDDAKVALVDLGRHRRERIATAALQGLLSSDTMHRAAAESHEKWQDSAAALAEIAVGHADALIEELDKEQGDG